MISKVFDVASLLVIGAMLATVLKPGAPTASVIGALTHGFASDLLASEGRSE